jgi:hypothetical protein
MMKEKFFIVVLRKASLAKSFNLLAVAALVPPAKRKIDKLFSRSFAKAAAEQKSEQAIYDLII